MPCKERDQNLESCRKWREKNKEKIKKEYKLNKNGIKTRQNLRNKKNRLYYFEEKLKLECKRCGENHIACLEFHHLDPNKKEYEIASKIKHSFQKLKKEIKKCIVLCSNCHRKEHWDSNKIKKIKKDIKNLEEKNNEFIHTRIKKHSICRICGRNRKEVRFIKRRLFCVDCYREYQKNKMRKRRF